MGDEPRNIELFNRITAITLVRLYESFPNRIDLEGAAIGCEAAHDSQSDEETFEIIATTSSSAISFLVEEGFVRFDADRASLDGPDFPGARLTLRGFSLLGRVPAGVDPTADRRTFSQQLKEAVGEGAKASVSDIVKSLFLGAVSLGVGAAG